MKRDQIQRKYIHRMRIDIKKSHIGRGYKRKWYKYR